MQVLDRLTAVLTAVGDDAVAVHKPLGGGDLRDHLEDAGHVAAVLGIHLVSRGHVSLRNDEDVGGSHGGDVAESVHQLVLVHLGGGNIPRDDLAENAVHMKIPFVDGFGDSIVHRNRGIVKNFCQTNWCLYVTCEAGIQFLVAYKNPLRLREKLKGVFYLINKY